ncbi:BON domain-containing protein (plasmid) [Lichenicola cladoniae]|uniref:BON domain-containing protein n=2 Tax=Lichenicola cladoniae TaxID=1484109 RepID=A0A6M8HZA5_9PROT|nr:BON domain-containing protein [Acetobacteraceae bacterium]QKE93596.1 BON domain-containing protein [Lichenicola cladoniae]
MTEDSNLQYAVLAEFNWEPSVDPANIGVTARNGIVTLSGHVGTFVEKYAAESAAARVKGVLGVAEEIEVRLPFGITRTDGEIAAAAVERMAWDVVIPRDAVKIKVEAGWVTLSGEVDAYHQKNAAEREIRSLIGVIGLSNQIVIRPRIDTRNLSDNVMHALHRSRFFDANTITVEANGGHIHLTGNVHTPHERRVAAATAWAAPGATSVQNDLAIL